MLAAPCTCSAAAKQQQQQQRTVESEANAKYLIQTQLQEIAVGAAVCSI
jgi:hypothetical protein